MDVLGGYGVRAKASYLSHMSEEYSAVVLSLREKL
jgi:hypothetical protein